MTTDAGPTRPPKRIAKSLREEFFNLPNQITLLRIWLIPVVGVLLWWGDPLSCFWASLWYTFAAFSDMVDGWLARRQNIVTVIGKFLDPLADKLLVLTILLVLLPKERVPMWIAIVIVVREVTITGLRAVASSEGMVIAAETLGKFKTAFQLAGLPGVMLHYTYWIGFGFVDAPINFSAIGHALLTISVVFGIVSAGEYIWGFFRALQLKRAQAEPAEG